MVCIIFACAYQVPDIKHQACTSLVHEESTRATCADYTAEAGKNYIQQLRLAFTSLQAYALQYYLGSSRKDRSERSLASVPWFVRIIINCSYGVHKLFSLIHKKSESHKWRLSSKKFLHIEVTVWNFSSTLLYCGTVLNRKKKLFVLKKRVYSLFLFLPSSQVYVPSSPMLISITIT